MTTATMTYEVRPYQITAHKTGRSFFSRFDAVANELKTYDPVHILIFLVNFLVVILQGIYELLTGRAWYTDTSESFIALILGAFVADVYCIQLAYYFEQDYLALVTYLLSGLEVTPC